VGWKRGCGRWAMRIAGAQVHTSSAVDQFDSLRRPATHPVQHVFNRLHVAFLSPLDKRPYDVLAVGEALLRLFLEKSRKTFAHPLVEGSNFGRYAALVYTRVVSSERLARTARFLGCYWLLCATTVRWFHLPREIILLFRPYRRRERATPDQGVETQCGREVRAWPTKASSLFRCGRLQSLVQNGKVSLVCVNIGLIQRADLNLNSTTVWKRE
jgi:hypothetical protein